MNEYFLVLKAGLEACFTVQNAATAAWHDMPPEEPVCTKERTMENFRNLVLREHLCNFRLWHLEDQARRPDATDSQVADYKRKIDAMNQRRNDSIEAMDICFLEMLSGHLPAGASHRQNTETLGMVVDRISILALKIFHMEEQTRRMDATSDHLATCGAKLQVLRKQHGALVRSLLELVDDYATGEKVPAMYYQFKMYNDPNLNPEMYEHRI